MKLNHDCVRKVLLTIESDLEYGDTVDSSELQIKGFEQSDIIYSVAKLFEAGYIDGEPVQYVGEAIPNICIESLTWNGHKFLDTIRDNQVWSTTKGIASKFASVSVSMIENIAAQVLTNLIEQYIVTHPITLP